MNGPGSGAPTVRVSSSVPVQSWLALFCLSYPLRERADRQGQSATGSNVVSLVFMYFNGYWVSL